MSSKKAIRIGLPRGLLYHTYAPMWEQFFRSLGCEVITSPETNRQILEKGIQYSIDENCLAVKIFLGHVEYLKDRVDYLFIPRIKSLYKDEKTCVKLFALGDIVRNTFEDAQVLEYTIDETNNQPEWMGIFKIGMSLHQNPLRVWQTYRDAVKKLQNHNRALIEKQKRLLDKSSPSTVRVLLASHTYVMHDALMGKSVVKLLQSQGVEVLDAHNLEEDTARRLSTNLSADLYWSYNKELLGAIEFYRGMIDGIIFLMAFPCGPDSLVTCLCQHKISDIPMCVLNMDELQGDAGLKTRLESFIDILRFKKEKGQ
jgi:predicted nucleotide-binding protein (sugar kinase/HSP70/actin superfamily)